MTEDVTYRDVPEWPGYRVGNDRSVWSQRRGSSWYQLRIRIVSGARSRRELVQLQRDGKTWGVSLDELVEGAFPAADSTDRPPGLSSDVEVRPVPEYPGYFMASDRSAWSRRSTCRRRLRPARPGGQMPWRRLSVVVERVGSPRVSVRRDGARSFVAVDDLMRATFPPPPIESNTPVPVPVSQIAARPAEPGPVADPIEYRPVEGFPGYRVGMDRTVWSCFGADGISIPPVWHLRTLTVRRGHTATVSLSRDGRKITRSADKLYREAFPPVVHRSIELADFGPEARGSDHGRAVLDAEKVTEARRLKAEGWTYPQLVKRFGVSRNTLYYAISGRTWTHVPPESGPMTS